MSRIPKIAETSAMTNLLLPLVAMCGRIYRRYRSGREKVAG
jgi:hypothetical protein